MASKNARGMKREGAQVDSFPRFSIEGREGGNRKGDDAKGWKLN